MSIFRSTQFRLAVALLALSLLVIGCSVAASNSVYFGKVTPPAGQVLRYVTGSEIESLDPQIGTGQPDARVYGALYDGLVEYGPEDSLPIPAIAESWDVNSDSSELVFHLRTNARWSNGEPITAKDFVYTFRRGLSPALASRNAYLAYYIKYSQGYNTGGSFVRDPKTGEFVLEKDVLADAASTTESSATNKPPTGENPALDTPFHQFMHSPARLVLSGDDKEREGQIKDNPKIKDAIAGKDLVPVEAKDIGVEAIDDYTLRVTLRQPAPFFLGLMAHQFFRAIPQKVIEQYGDTWTQPGHIITSGPYRLKEWIPYDRLVVEKDPTYWDADKVQLTRITFYPVKDSTTIMNLYKAGEIDAFLNHTVPQGWIDVVRPLHDYMGQPENGNDYYDFNCRRGPFTDKRLRKAFNLAIDKVAFARWRKTVKPLTGFVPEGIFPGYPNPKGDDFNPERARQLLTEAGYPVTKEGDRYVCKNFPVDQIEVTYNPDGMNAPIAEFLQAQWKQNLGITVPLRSLEFRTFLQVRASGDYKGISRDAWGGDYMDPFTFLNLFYKGAENGSGWNDPKYDAMLDRANRESDPQKRFELFAKAEAYMLEEQPVIPLDTPTVNWMKKPYVKGMYGNPLTLHPWKFVYIEHDQAKWEETKSNNAE